MSQSVPIEINHIRNEDRVRITWNDGHLWEYPLDYLRGYCPCALCQGHGAEEKKQFIPVTNAKLGEIRPVGNYAVEFRWADGHNTGIYTFPYLRSLCRCPECERTPSGRS